MSNADVPIWEKYTLTIEEASKCFRIGESKRRKLAEENPAASWAILNATVFRSRGNSLKKSLTHWTQFSLILNKKLANELKV